MSAIAGELDVHPQEFLGSLCEHLGLLVTNNGRRNVRRSVDKVLAHLEYCFPRSAIPGLPAEDHVPATNALDHYLSERRKPVRSSLGVGHKNRILKVIAMLATLIVPYDSDLTAMATCLCAELPKGDNDNCRRVTSWLYEGFQQLSNDLGGGALQRMCWIARFRSLERNTSC